MWRPTRCNCLIWAFVMRMFYGGKLITGRSEYGWWPHVQWLDVDGSIWEYVPTIRVRRTEWRNLLPVRALLFRGSVQYVGKVTRG